MSCRSPRLDSRITTPGAVIGKTIVRECSGWPVDLLSECDDCQCSCSKPEHGSRARVSVNLEPHSLAGIRGLRGYMMVQQNIIYQRIRQSRFQVLTSIQCSSHYDLKVPKTHHEPTSIIVAKLRIVHTNHSTTDLKLIGRRQFESRSSKARQTLAPSLNTLTPSSKSLHSE